MKRRFRLSGLADFQRVRHSGRSFAHPLVVLVALKNDLEGTRFAVVAGRSLGGAVERNRIRRRIRAALHPHLASIVPGWDVLLIARRSIFNASFEDIRAALISVITRAQLIIEDHVD